MITNRRRDRNGDGPRACRPEEIPALLDLVNLVFDHERGQAPSQGAQTPQVFGVANCPNIRVVVRDRRIVSTASVYPLLVRVCLDASCVPLKVGCVGSVATHPAYRQQGLATQVLEDCIRRMQLLGCHISWLGTGIPDFYRRLGWELGGAVLEFELDRRALSSLPRAEALAMLPDHCLDAAAATALWRRSAGASDRSVRWFRVLVERAGYAALMGRRHGRYVAYVVLQQGAVIEHGGPAETVAALIREAYLPDGPPPDRPEAWVPPGGEGEAVTVIAPPSSELAAYLTDRGIAGRRRPAGMLRVIDARLITRLWRRRVCGAPDAGNGGHPDGSSGRAAARAGDTAGVEARHALAQVQHAVRERFFIWPLDRV